MKQKRFAEEFAKDKEKNPKLTYEQFLETKTSILESALYQSYTDYDELIALLQIVRNSMDSPAFSNYTTRTALTGLLGVAINNQCNMMDCAGLEY